MGKQSRLVSLNKSEEDFVRFVVDYPGLPSSPVARAERIARALLAWRGDNPDDVTLADVDMVFATAFEAPASKPYKAP